MVLAEKDISTILIQFDFCSGPRRNNATGSDEASEYCHPYGMRLAFSCQMILQIEMPPRKRVEKWQVNSINMILMADSETNQVMRDRKKGHMSGML